jgi:hypothetical protein
MLFQVRLSALHLDILAGRERRINLIVDSGTGLYVLPALRRELPFQLLANKAGH